MAPEGSIISGIPGGQYKLVSVAVDLTGKKLIDEICHIGAFYEPDKEYSQYVMPHREVSRAAVRTHGIRIVTNFGRFRVLKDATTNKTLRTKSEYSTLSEFMEWLKEAKGESDGVLLAFHDNNRNQVTPFFIDALMRYKLLDEFFQTVKGFINICKYAETTEAKDRSVLLRALCRRHLDKDQDKNNSNFLQSAKDRAKYGYLLLQKLSKAENDIVIEDLLPFVSNREDEVKNLAFQRELAEKVRALKLLKIQESEADKKSALKPTKNQDSEVEIKSALKPLKIEDPETDLKSAMKMKPIKSEDLEATIIL